MTGPTLSELQASLQAKGYGTDSATAQTGALNSTARRVYGSRQWPFHVGTDTVNTVSGTASVAVPDDVNQLDAVRLERATDYQDLDWADPEWVRTQAHGDRSLGEPRYWSRQGDTLLLYPIPDGIYTLTLAYTIVPEDMASASDEAAIPHQFMDVIVWGAIIEMAFRQRDWAQVDRATAQYDSRLLEMARAFAQPHRQGPLTVQASGYYDDMGDNPWLP